MIPPPLELYEILIISENWCARCRPIRYGTNVLMKDELVRYLKFSIQPIVVTESLKFH